MTRNIYCTIRVGHILGTAKLAEFPLLVLFPLCPFDLKREYFRTLWPAFL